MELTTQQNNMNTDIADHGIITKSLDTGQKLNVHDIFNLRPVSRMALQSGWKNFCRS